jgi:hypothetical protein
MYSLPYLLLLIEVAPVLFVPDFQKYEANQHTTQVCKMGNIIAGRILDARI